MLWYFSEEKARVLVEDVKKWSFFPRDLEIKLKEPFTSSEAVLKQSSKEPEYLKKVKELKSKQGLLGFHELKSAPMPVLCTFEAEGARITDTNGFWLAVARNDIALLLGGSPMNAIGKHGSAGDSISPSADPVGTMLSAFRSPEAADVSSNLSFAWGEVWQTSEGQLSMPFVRGLCVLAGIWEASATRMRSVGMPGIERLVVGSPIYVEQI